MIPLCLVTGWLGAGKTTLLQRLVEQIGDRRVAWLVNEFNQIDVDGQRLDLAPGQLVSISGGSIFCRCKVSEFIEQLGRIAARPDLEGLVIEASGMADPRVIDRMLAETGMDACIERRRTIVVVDPVTWPKISQTLPNAGEQVAAADGIVLNRCDTVDAERLDAVERDLRRRRPDADLHRSEHCRVAIDPFPAGRRSEEAGAYAPCRDPHYHTAAASGFAAVDWPRLRDAIDADLGERCYRAKGSIATRNQRLRVDRAGDAWQEMPDTKNAESSLVLICAGDASATADDLMQQLANGAFAAPIEQGASHG